MLRYEILAAFAIAAAAPALAGPRIETGEFDGEKFHYTAELKAKGQIHFAGVLEGSGETFELDVRKNGHVVGHFGGALVEYDVDKALRDKVAAQLGEEAMVADATLRN